MGEGFGFERKPVRDTGGGRPPVALRIASVRHCPGNGLRPAESGQKARGASSPVRWNRRRPVAAGGMSGADSVSDGVGILAGLLPVRPEPQSFRPDGGADRSFPGERKTNEASVSDASFVFRSVPGCYFSVPSSACRIMSSLAVMTISTRRFWARPSAVELSAMGAS